MKQKQMKKTARNNQFFYIKKELVRIDKQDKYMLRFFDINGESIGHTPLFKGEAFADTYMEIFKNFGNGIVLGILEEGMNNE